MDKKHYNELIILSQEIYDQATRKLTDFITDHYGETTTNATHEQMEDYLLVALETSSYLLGNALALLEPAAQEDEIRNFNDNLRRVIAFAEKQLGNDIPPS